MLRTGGGDAKDNTGTQLSRCAPIAGKGVRSNWRAGGCSTLVDATAVAREKPFLFAEGDALKVFVPAVRRGAKGVSWGAGKANGGMGDGVTLDLAKDFHVAIEGQDDSKSINDAVVDHTWIWRADHGEHTGWDANTSRNGIVVNGDRVSCYGLFVEHFQEHDVLWNGEDGTTYFL